MASVMQLLLFVVRLALLSAPCLLASNEESNGIGRRVLLSFRETPRGSNLTFECSPSGPCIPCQYSEKSDEKYHCSETGYRIPLRCVEIEEGVKVGNGEVSQSERSNLEIFPTNARLLADSSMKERKSEAYITYRSCIPAVNEEKLSVLGFEGIVFLLLLISGSAVYFRKRNATAMSGFTRIQTNSSATKVSKKELDSLHLINFPHASSGYFQENNFVEYKKQLSLPNF